MPNYHSTLMRGVSLILSFTLVLVTFQLPMAASASKVNGQNLDLNVSGSGGASGPDGDGQTTINPGVPTKNEAADTNWSKGTGSPIQLLSSLSGCTTGGVSTEYQNEVLGRVNLGQAEIIPLLAYRHIIRIA